MPKPFTLKITAAIDSDDDAIGVLSKLTDGDTADKLAALSLQQLRMLRRVVQWLERSRSEAAQKTATPPLPFGTSPPASAGGPASDA